MVEEHPVAKLYADWDVQQQQQHYWNNKRDRDCTAARRCSEKTAFKNAIKAETNQMQ